MEVIRDDTWQKIYKGVSATCHDESYCTRFTNAAWRYRARVREIEARRASRQVKLLHVKRETPQKKGVGFCQGKTKSGEPCRFKASCNGYCKKHSM